MRLALVTMLAASIAALLAFPAYAARDNIDVRGRVDIGLGDFEVVIGDLGDKSDSWNGSPTRVHIEVMDGRSTHDSYFDSLPAALFVLHEMYDSPRIVQIDVPDYLGQGLIDGLQAYYVLDYEHHSRGGLPLVLAFGNYRDALDELQYRNGELLGFNDLVTALNRWEDNNRDLIYWRGWDRNRWDSAHWSTAWNNRWTGWGWDNNRGWLRLNVNLGNDGRDRNRDRNNREQYDRRQDDSGHGDRARGDGHERDRGNNDGGQVDRERGNGNQRDRSHEDNGQGGREHGNGGDRVRDNGDQSHGAGNGHGDNAGGNGKGHAKDKGDQGQQDSTNRQSGRVR